MNKISNNDSVSKCVELILQSKSTIVLTGAGISTSAGIPDFRGPQGLYTSRLYDPEKVFDIAYFLKDPKPFYEFALDFIALESTIAPTPTHHALAKLEGMGKIHAIITQNIDGLHQKAGSQKVLDMHGSFLSSHCLRCHKAYDYDELKSMVLQRVIPHCSCRGIIKPDIVFFGEDVKYYHKALELAQGADLFFVIDTEQWHYLSALTGYFIRSSYKIGFATRANRAKLFSRPIEYDLQGYELDNFLRLFKGVLIPADFNGLEGSFFINVTDQAWAKGQIHDKSIAVFLGASIVLRRLNEKQMMAIVRGYLEKNYSIILLGGKDVIFFADAIAAKINSSKVLNYVGKLSLMQSGALIQQSSLFIGPDSGLMHLACALDVPVIGIFGPGNLAKWGPKGIKHKVITENALCSPCTRFGYTLPTCHGSYHCMKNIKIDKQSLI